MHSPLPEGEAGTRTKFARHLRQNSTNAESILWYHLRNRLFKNYKFRRQEPVKNFIVDFIYYEQRLIIELDGGQHAENKNIQADEQRTKILESLDYRVLRFWNNDITQDISNVLELIYRTLNTKKQIKHNSQ